MEARFGPVHYEALDMAPASDDDLDPAKWSTQVKPGGGLSERSAVGGVVPLEATSVALPGRPVALVGCGIAVARGP